MDDSLIIQQILSGNQDSFKVLIDKYKTYAVYLAYSFLKSQVEAEECAMDAFVQIYKKLPDLRHSSAFRAYLYQIIKTTAIYRKREKDRIVPLEPFSNPTPSPAFESSPQEDVREKLNQEEMKANILSAIKTLPEKYSQIIIMRYIEELPIEDISRELNMPSPTVRIRIMRGLERLKEKVQDFHINLLTLL